MSALRLLCRCGATIEGDSAQDAYFEKWWDKHAGCVAPSAPIDTKPPHRWVNEFIGKSSFRPSATEYNILTCLIANVQDEAYRAGRMVESDSWRKLGGIYGKQEKP